MNALQLARLALLNFQPTTSVVAGGAASIIVYALGAVLVATGIAIPLIGVPTMGMVAIASPIIGHIVTALVPDSVNQNLKGLATNLNTTAGELRAVIPQFEDKFPGDYKQSDTVTNLYHKN